MGPGSKVLLIGDSLAVGLAPPLGALAKDAKVQLASMGRTGTTINAWSGGALGAELNAKLAEFKPGLVLVSLGTNDEYLSPASLARVKDDTERLLRLLEPYPVVWILPPTLPKTIGVAAYLKSRAPHPFDSSAYSIPRASDQIHPTVAGYSGWAGKIWGAIS